MATAGPNIVGTGADDATIGVVAWTSPGNATADDAAFATAAVDGLNQITHYLKGTNLGFAIPSGATINGIQVEFKVKAVGAASGKDHSVKIVKGGTIGGTDKATGTTVSSTISYVSYGGTSDLWGLAWTPADINASTFGAVYSGTFVTSGDVTFSIDAIRVTVTYTPVANPIRMMP